MPSNPNPLFFWCVCVLWAGGGGGGDLGLEILVPPLHDGLPVCKEQTRKE